MMRDQTRKRQRNDDMWNQNEPGRGYDGFNEPGRGFNDNSRGFNDIGRGSFNEGRGYGADRYQDNFNDNYNDMPFNSGGGYGGGFGNNMPQSYNSGPVIVNCSELRDRHVGAYVQISGRLSSIRANRFAELRDMHGVTQLLATDDKHSVLRELQELPLDSRVTVLGEVQLRPKVNSTLPTGQIEIHLDRLVGTDHPIPSQHMNQFDRFDDQQTRDYTARPVQEKPIVRGVTASEFKKTDSENILKYFTNRKTTCGELRGRDADRAVTLVGWVENKRHGRFLQMRDGHGTTQIVIKDLSDIKETVAAVTDDSIVLIRGKVKLRPIHNQNIKKDTGEIEVYVEEMRILDPAAPYDGTETESADADVDMEGNTDETGSLPVINKYTYRTHNCGELRINHVGAEVTICGWVEYQRMKKFLVLRDGYGCTQIILPEEEEGGAATSSSPPSVDIESVPYESIVKVTGVVMARPLGTINEKMTTGHIEVYMKTLEVLNAAKSNLPIELREHNRTGEFKRLEHRYIDLRCAIMQKNLRTRSQVLMKMREYLINKCGFVEVETPTLFRRTPGGAQEFIVPSRKRGHFYSLVQSPQQFKQMLMAGAIDRYFQIARCYRDEATRPDRQPEFTQLDIELSFTNREHIMALVETILVKSWPEREGALSTPFQRMQYEEVMEQYGSDKPDTRYGKKLKNVTSLVTLNEDIALPYKNFGAYTIVLRFPKSVVPGNLMAAIKKMEKNSAAKLVFSKIGNGNVMEWVRGSISKLLSEVVAKALAAHLHLNEEDRLFLVYGEKEHAQKLLGKIRSELIDCDLIDKPIDQKSHNFLWVTDFPLFTTDEQTGALETVHHPFTAPNPEDLHMLSSFTDYSTTTLEQLENLLKIRSLAYDLVLDGQEVGGGSIRIHDAAMQKKVLNILGLDTQNLQHMLDALESGCPPHGGIALGLDRLLAIICHAKSIRDLIAFPKSLDGKDLLSKAPVPITNAEKLLYHIEIMDEAQEKLLRGINEGTSEDDPMESPENGEEVAKVVG